MKQNEYDPALSAMLQFINGHNSVIPHKVMRYHSQPVSIYTGVTSFNLNIPSLLYVDKPSPSSDLCEAPWAPSMAAMQEQSRKAADVSLWALAVASLIEG